MGRANVSTNRFVAPVLGSAIALLLVTAGLAAASIPSSSGAINGCYNNSTGALRVIDKDAGAACNAGETALNWNQTGPRGPTGATGPAGPGAETPAGVDAFMTCTGAKIGKITGGVKTKGLEGMMQIVAVEHAIVSPRDPATGQATGKRQHKPLAIVKPVDQATPLLTKALVTNENLTSCVLRFYVKSSLTGALTNYYTITLTNASITEINTAKGDTRFQQGRLAEYEEVSFVYQKIDWTYVNPPITVTDSPFATP